MFESKKQIGLLIHVFRVRPDEFLFKFFPGFWNWDGWKRKQPVHSVGNFLALLFLQVVFLNGFPDNGAEFLPLPGGNLFEVGVLLVS